MFIPDPVCRTIAIAENLTNPNPDPGQKCKFPFTHNRKTFTKCIRTEVDANFWCGTEMPAKESEIIHDKKWGICNDMCEREIGIFTLRPRHCSPLNTFIYQYKLFLEYINPHMNRFWLLV